MGRGGNQTTAEPPRNQPGDVFEKTSEGVHQDNLDLYAKALGIAEDTKIPDSDAVTDPYYECLHVLFERQAERTPHEVALVDNQSSYTYKELDEVSNLLAGFLRQKGFSLEDACGIHMERCAENVIAILATLKAGGGYCPVELAYPKALIGEVLSDLKPRVVLTKQKYVTNLSQEGPFVFCMDEGWVELLQSQASGYPLSAWRNAVEPNWNNLCYIIYSSGSTGKPKGIVAPHLSPVHSYLWRYNVSSYEVGDRVACNVFFVWEALRPLLKGATTYVIPDDVVYDSYRLVDYLEIHSITETLFTPSLLESVLNSLEHSGDLATRLTALKTLWLNGEVVTVTLRQRFLDAFPSSTRLLNTYSISECGEVAAHDLSNDFNLTYSPRFSPVGKPAAFADVLILGEDNLPVPYGESGELCVGGQGVGRGYLNRPDLTALAFVPHALRPGEQMYRTGDVARYLPDGTVEILGRCGSMVKLRGYSVVLGSVEVAMVNALGLKSCACTIQGAEGSEHKRLVAYIVPNKKDLKAVPDNVVAGEEMHGQVTHEDMAAFAADWSIDPVTGRSKAIMRAMSSHVASYAVPSVFVLLRELPMLPPPLGKLDRKSLPDPPALQPVRTFPAGYTMKPSADLSQLTGLIRGLMEEVLQLEPDTVCSDDDFMLLGGHSLAAARLSARLHEVLGTRVPVSRVIECRTPESLACGLLRVQLTGLVRGLMEEVLHLEPESVHDDDDFMLMGGHSLAAARLCARVQEVLSLRIPVSSVFENSTPGALGHALVNITLLAENKESAGYTGHAGGIQDVVAVMRKDAVLDSEMQELVTKGFMSPGTPTTLESATCIMITGATGFLGSFLLKELLTGDKYKGASLVCLVRGADGAKRLMGASAWEDCPSQQLLSHAMETGRVTVIRGDVGQDGMRMGVDDAEAWDHLVSNVDLVLHCAAHVNLSLPYQALHPGNVRGTLNIIRFAAHTRASLLYISSNAVFPWRVASTGARAAGEHSNCSPDLAGWKENTDLSALPLEELLTGYAQTKWVAEKLVWEAHKLGLPLTVFRLGNQCADCASGIYNPSDADMLIQAACLRLGSVPVVDGWRIEGTPVDFTAASIGAIGSEQCYIGQAFHIINPVPVSAQDILTTLQESGGYKPLQKVPLRQWMQDLQAWTSTTGAAVKVGEDSSAAQQAMLSVEAMLMAAEDSDADVATDRVPHVTAASSTSLSLASKWQMLWCPAVFDASSFDNALAHIGMERPPAMNAHNARTYLERMVRKGVLPAPSVSHEVKIDDW
eukprot:CAMPEP_0197846980 /NCGR_PEP_ID=MMETSP1438-20131217/4824_1 /TAXON_ID=1461541 /ORGANISM="Pterosperma sp., Strain CCMP1384" /LENGTH=1272 /DNA_ID=CAMNT_0043458773 /DNA_START=375 /DNA_END=4190 /DNA_ORIENTATION=+